MCTYVCVYLCMYLCVPACIPVCVPQQVPVCICVCTCVCTCVCVSVCVYLGVYLHLYLCVCMYTCACTCMCTCVYLPVCLPMWMCVYIHTIIFGVTIIFYKQLGDLDQKFLEGRVRELGWVKKAKWWKGAATVLVAPQWAADWSCWQPSRPPFAGAASCWMEMGQEPIWAQGSADLCWVPAILPAGNLGQASENLWGVRFTPLWTVSGVGVVVSDAPQAHGGHLASSPQSPEKLGWAASGWVELLGAFFWGLGLGSCGASPGQCEGHRTLTVSLCPLGTRKEPGVTESIRLRGLGLHPNAHLLLPRWPCHLDVLTGQMGTATTLQGLWGVPQAPRGAPSWAETQGWPCVAAKRGEKQRVCFELAMTRLKSKSVLRPWEFYFPSTFTGDHESVHPSAACVMKKTCSML